MVEKVLVVDDQKGIRQLLQEFLAQEGYQVITVGNGQAAISAVKQQQIDLIIMDMNMPGMNGLETAEIILHENKYIPVILMTAYAKKEIQEAARAVGINRCIIKPFEFKELKDMVINY